MTSSRFLTIAIAIIFFETILSMGCTKNSSPSTTVYDTVTIVKNDTTIKIDTTYLVQNDTLYYPRPDSTVNLTKGLLVYLNFTGNIADSSGNNNPTQSFGNVLTYDTHGYANNAFGADGGGEKIYVSNNGSIVFDTAWSLTTAFMVNDSRAETYISMVDPNTGYGPSFNFGNTLATLPYLACGSGDVSTDCGTYGTVNNLNITDSTSFVPVVGSWYKAVVIYHKGTLQTYINGSLISTKIGSGTQALLCSNSQMIIGAWWSGDPQGMNGKLDNVRLYNRVLTPHEIAWLSTSYQVTSNSLQRGVRIGQAGK
jgi:Concanavalin A-like lectin/glucanases superfamily